MEGSPAKSNGVRLETLFQAGQASDRRNSTIIYNTPKARVMDGRHRGLEIVLLKCSILAHLKSEKCVSSHYATMWFALFLSFRAM